MQMRSLRQTPRHLALQSLTRWFEGKKFFFCKANFPYSKRREFARRPVFSGQIPLKKDGNFSRQ